MKIAVCIKQVPSRDWQPRIDDTHTWIREQDASFEMNEPDAYALEEGLRLKEKHGGEVVVCSRDDVVAASFLLRTFEDAVVRSIPDAAPIMEAFPGAQVELLVREGQRLSENDDDVLSHRLAVIALSGPDRETLVERYRQAVELLPFELSPVRMRVSQNS